MAGRFKDLLLVGSASDPDYLDLSCMLPDLSLPLSSVAKGLLV